MASRTQSNPVYYSLSSVSSGHPPQSRTVVLRKRPDHNGFGVYIGEDIPSGLYVVTIERNSPASDAKLQPGDRVLAINGQLITSTSKNPKEMLMKAASHADSLTLTIQSNDILQTLDTSLTNNYSNKNDHSVQRNSSKRNSTKPTSTKPTSTKQPSAVNLDLENYIKSLFIDENVQILQTPNNNEFVFKSDPNKTSSVPLNSIPNRYYYASDPKKERPRQRHSKRIVRETREIQTQTSFDDDEYSSYPTTADTNSHFTAVPPPPSPPPPPPPKNVTRNSVENSHPSSKQRQQHMVDIVEAAVIAQRKREKVNKREQISSRDSAPVTTRTTSPPPSRDTPPAPKRTTTPPPSRDVVVIDKRTTTPPSSRDASPATKRTTTPSPSRDTPPATKRTTTPPPSRDVVVIDKRTTTPPPSRDAPPATKRTTTPPPSRDVVVVDKRTTTPPPSRDAPPATTRTTTPPPPPPYSETPVAVIPVEAPNNQANADAGEHQEEAGPPTVVDPSLDEGLREIHLRREPNFQGFGFHLQYNKMYYLVQSIEADSPAHTAGLHANDVIHAIDHQTTTDMPHGIFVETVNARSDIDLTVQTLNAYLRAHPPPVRNQQMAAAVTAAIHTDTEKHKTGVAKVLGKLTSR